MHTLLAIWFGWVRDWGYTGIVLLMAMESSIFPVPSEVVMPPAAFWAAQGKMNFWGVVLAGTVGSWLGAAITYWVSRWIGRPLLLKYGRYVFITEEKLIRTERWLARYEAGGIFFARLLPVVRHLISIPAGIMRMNFGSFSLMTLAGSALWCWVLSVFGQRVIGAHPYLMESPEKLVDFMKSQCLWLVGFVILIGALYILVMRLTEKKKNEAAT
ncbi:MAG: DedA family protein [Verrucomicrobiae bacterium]|nr:DedA family protein [Verrucomicrobiae bacterium]